MIYKLIALEQPRRGVELLAVVNGHVVQVRELAPLIFTSRSEQGEKAASRRRAGAVSWRARWSGRCSRIARGRTKWRKGRSIRRAVRARAGAQRDRCPVVDLLRWFQACRAPPMATNKPCRTVNAIAVAHDTPRAKEDLRSPAGTALGAPAAAGGSAGAMTRTDTADRALSGANLDRGSGGQRRACARCGKVGVA